MEFEKEIALLRERLERETNRRIELEDECDLLATENERLRGILHLHGLSEKPQPLHVDPSREIDGLLMTGDSGYAKREILKKVEAAGNGNVLSVGLLGNDDNFSICTGGVDKQLRFYDIAIDSDLDYSIAETHRVPVSAPILSIDSTKCGNLIACSLMDGSVVITVSNPININDQIFHR